MVEPPAGIKIFLTLCGKTVFYTVPKNRTAKPKSLPAQNSFTNPNPPSSHGVAI